MQESPHLARAGRRGYVVRRVTDESRDPPHLAADADRPSSPESANSPPEPRDRGRSVALGILGGLVLLGVALIARGPQGAPSGASASPVAALTSAELPSAVVGGVGSTRATAADGGGSPDAPSSSPAADAGPKFVPVWRVAALAHDPGIEILKGTLGKHSFAAALAQTGLAKAEVRRITHATDDIRRIEHGVSKDAFVVARDRAKGTAVAFEYIVSPTEIWQAGGQRDESLATKKLELFVEKKRTQSALVVTADLAKAIAAAGLREEAIEEIDDALDGHGDAAVVKPGVRLRVIGDEEWVEGAFARFRVSAVEYVPKTGEHLRLYYYERDAAAGGNHRHVPRAGFYDAKGVQPFRGTFRSPVPLARITSRFNPKRMHPVLHVVMPHNGIDFGATTGTPVFAASSGTVHSAGDSGPCGNMVQIDHSQNLSTAYCHLSRFAPGIHAGQHVEERQLVGFVGQTGRVTGPHLHFAVKRGGTFIDPMGLKMDGVRTLPPSDREVFAKLRADLDVALESVVLPPADGTAAPDDKDDKDDNKDEPGAEE
jgi:murein DD-endopeptidase MepM/ murein hydrolase activator NlpD